jgi:hypothetical protein
VGEVRRGLGLAAGRHDRRADREDLAHHEDEIAAHITFNYAVLDEGETELLGCVYIDPADDRSPAAVTRCRLGGWSTRGRRRARTRARRVRPALARGDLGLSLGSLLPVIAKADWYDIRRASSTKPATYGAPSATAG